MRRIDLNDPFETTLVLVLSLPDGSVATSDAEIVEALRDLYTAAHGRKVETVIGSIPIAPPTDPLLKSKSWPLNSRTDLLVLASRRTVNARAASVNGLPSTPFDFVGYRRKIAKRRPSPPYTERARPGQATSVPNSSE